MNKRLKKLLEQEVGADAVEYSVALAILIVVFVAASIFLRTAAERRANESLRTAEETLPCNPPGGDPTKHLSGDECL